MIYLEKINPECHANPGSGHTSFLLYWSGEKKKKGKKIPQNSTSTGEGAASTVYLLSSGLKSHLKNALYCVYERYLFYKNTNNKNKLQCVCVYMRETNPALSTARALRPDRPRARCASD